ncbi:DUF134 domain-containing protein [Flavonifractor plautii]|nr:DUF134 domain-containing protein [Flavonifractor plautii]
MPRPKNADASVPCPDAAASAPGGAADGRVEMAVEEYEAIRLIDLLGCTQEECAAQMGWPAPRCSRCTTPPGAGWLRPWWREAPAHLRRRLCALPPGRGVSRPGLRPAGLRYGTLWLRRVPAVQGKLGGYENENRGYL